MVRGWVEGFTLIKDRGMVRGWVEGFTLIKDRGMVRGWVEGFTLIKDRGMVRGWVEGFTLIKDRGMVRGWVEGFTLIKDRGMVRGWVEGFPLIKDRGMVRVGGWKVSPLGLSLIIVWSGIHPPPRSPSHVWWAHHYFICSHRHSIPVCKEEDTRLGSYNPLVAFPCPHLTPSHPAKRISSNHHRKACNLDWAAACS